MWAECRETTKDNAGPAWFFTPWPKDIRKIIGTHDLEAVWRRPVTEILSKSSITMRESGEQIL